MSVISAAFAEAPRLLMKTTLGEITLELDAEKAPITTLNFIKYSQNGFYEGTIFHRVMPHFMIQAGGFTETMDKKKGLLPPIQNEWRNGLKNLRGTIAMARLSRQPDSATAQFFINVVDNKALDQPRDGAGYAVFGKVIKGLDVIDKIRNTKTQNHPKYPAGKVVPTVPVVIHSVNLLGEYDVEQLEAKLRRLSKK